MAGEIQLNSTTMATESSGSITAELDTIRPNTTNGSLTLQGDSSNAGVTGLTIDSSGNATFAQTISGGTLGSSVVFPAGHVIQTVQHVTTSTASITSSTTNTFASFSTAFKKSITPIKTNSKILIFISMNVGNDDATIHLELFRDGSVITGSIGDADLSRLRSNAAIRYNGTPYGLAVNNINFNFLDSPTISDPPTEIEYEIKGTAGATYSETFYLNRSANDNDGDFASRTSSTITLMEVAG